MTNRLASPFTMASSNGVELKCPYSEDEKVEIMLHAGTCDPTPIKETSFRSPGVSFAKSVLWHQVNTTLARESDGTQV